MAAQLRAAVVGCGIVTTRDILPNLQRPEVRERLVVQAVCDLMAERSAMAAERFGVPEHFADYRELIARDDIDVVLVATPIPAHAAVATAAAAAGKHVYVQKTMTVTVAEADELIAAARARGVKVVASPGQHLRPDLGPHLATLRDLISGGAIGRVRWGTAQGGMRHEDEGARFVGDDPLTNVDPSWYYQPGGGPLRDVSVYNLHTITWLLGPARRVTAFSGVAAPVREFKGRRIDVAMDDNTAAVIDFGDNTFVMLQAQTVSQAHGPGLELGAERGSIVFASGGFRVYERTDEIGTWGRGERLLAEGQPIPKAPGEERNYGLHILADIMHLVDCIAEDRRPSASAEHARHVIEIIEGIYESARAGRAVELNTTF
jgi:predicted dehydrogenase